MPPYCDHLLSAEAARSGPSAASAEEVAGAQPARSRWLRQLRHSWCWAGLAYHQMPGLSNRLGSRFSRARGARARTRGTRGVLAFELPERQQQSQASIRTPTSDTTRSDSSNPSLLSSERIWRSLILRRVDFGPLSGLIAQRM